MKDSSDLKYFLLSLALHLSLLLLLVGKMTFFPGERPEFIRAVRVDFVALPDKEPQQGPVGEEKPQPLEPVTKVEKTPPPAAEEKKSTPEEKPIVDLNSKKNKEPQKQDSKDRLESSKKTDLKDKQSSALKRLEALAKIKKLKSLTNAPEGTSYKGNRLSEGSSLTGVEKLEHNKYLSQLDSHIKKNWLLPEWLAQKPFTTAVLIRFDENGQILEKRILKASGNIEFDQEALKAVTSSVPFPAPPENLISYFKNHGIELRFPE